jgi:DNA-binding LytR/AlgR family response regulator
VDDEPLAIKVIESYVDRIGDMEIVATFTDSNKAFSYLHQNKVDLLFLDIQMPALNGFDLLRVLSQKPEIIITTAFREYAVESFELDVLDYLVKPISFERFLKSVQKYFKVASIEMDNKNIAKIQPIEEVEAIFVKENKKMVKLELDKILYIESLKDYVRFHTKGRNIVCKMSMNELEQILPSDRFIRVHRSYIIPFKKIESFSTSNIELSDIKIPIGNTYKLIVMKRLDFLLN